MLPGKWDLSALLIEIFKYWKVLVSFNLVAGRGRLSWSFKPLSRTLVVFTRVMCTWQVVRWSFISWFPLSYVHISHRKPQSWWWEMGAGGMKMRSRAHWGNTDLGPFCILLTLSPCHCLISLSLLHVSPWMHIRKPFFLGSALGKGSLQMETNLRMWDERLDQSWPCCLSPG